MTAFPTYGDYDALGLAELARTGQVNPVELVEEAIARIEALNPQLNAVVIELFEQAVQRARGHLPEGPFKGVPFLLKDLAARLADAPMYWGSAFFKRRQWRPQQSTTVVERYLASGLIIVGKSNTSELGLMPSTEPRAFGPTRNPYDPSLTAGGSSGGTAAAVAARMVPFGDGSDGGGSIRVPAAMTGLFGLKPSRGRVPVGPQHSELWGGFAAEHVLTRSVRDSAAMLDAIAGPAIGEWHHLPAPDVSFAEEARRDPPRLRIAFSAEPYLGRTCHPDCEAALDDAVELLSDLGHVCIEARPSLDGAAFARHFLCVVAAWIASAVHNAVGEAREKVRRGDFETETRLLAKLGASISGAEYVSSLHWLQRAGAEVQRFAADYDVLLNPTAAQPPRPLGFLRAQGFEALGQRVAAAMPAAALRLFRGLVERRAGDTFEFIPWTGVYNVTGQPSMSVPLYWNGAGLPVGVMFTAQRGDEATLFRLAHQLEEARPWFHRRPPICA